MGKYTLVNPKISGPEAVTSVKSDDPYKAGRNMYTKMAWYFTNRINRAYLTVKDKHGELYHMRVEEEEKDDRPELVSLTVTPLVGDVSEEGELSGGDPSLSDSLAHLLDIVDSEDDSDSDSDSDDYENYEKRPKEFYLPITNYIYYDLPYYRLDPTITKLTKNYSWTMPNFYHRQVPKIQIRRRLIPI